MELRIGQGIDIHPFVRGRKLILGGVEIPYEFGLEGHSDADALTHALIDALLGAASLGDIGVLFPNTDNRWKGISSIKLLELAWAKVREGGWGLVNADISVLLEKPKLRQFVDQMRTLLAKELNVKSEQIGIKATTAEQLGFVGRGEGVFVSAVVLLSRG